MMGNVLDFLQQKAICPACDLNQKATLTLVCTRTNPCQGRAEARTVHFGKVSHNFDRDGILWLFKTPEARTRISFEWNDGSDNISVQEITVGTETQTRKLGRFELVRLLGELETQDYVVFKDYNGV